MSVQRMMLIFTKEQDQIARYGLADVYNLQCGHYSWDDIYRKCYTVGVDSLGSSAPFSVDTKLCLQPEAMV